MQNNNEELELEDGIKDSRDGENDALVGAAPQEQEPMANPSINPQVDGDDELQEQLESQEPIEPEPAVMEPNPTPVSNGEPTQSPEQNVRMFSQDEVNKLVGKTRMDARDNTMRGLYEKYGVSDDKMMDDIFGKGQAYDVLNDNFNNTSSQLKEVMAENALLKSHITPERWNDVKLILNGKGMDVSAENIAIELATHPEWLGIEQQQQMSMEQPMQPQPTAQLEQFGMDIPSPDEEDVEEVKQQEFMKKYFGV